ncbi:hypothetical protein SK128_003911 [Halocaridina rubra]|uniref:Uncharacterized protein n=1 Tax=Halocaridina rubra TaxID=373956 RepID=A0AAN8ZZC3_HALRR
MTSRGDELDEEMELVEDLTLQVYRSHPGLLSKGFALSHPPTIHQALDGVIPFRSVTISYEFYSLYSQ